MTEKPRVVRFFVMLGVIMLVMGGAIFVEGVQHTLSGEPVPATSWTEESTGPTQLLFAAIFFVGGFLVLRRGLQGRE